jgi:hypothetical protein
MTPQENIIQLILNEINGTISDEDKVALHDIITDDEDLFQFYLKMNDELNSEEVMRGLDSLSKVDQSRTLLTFLTKQLYKRWVFVTLLFVLKSCVISGIIYYYYSMYMEKQMEVVRLKEQINAPAVATFK